jgi:hypothetical protein
MNRFASLKNLLVNSLFRAVISEHGRYSVHLKENGKHAKLKHVDIYGVHKDSILLKLDDIQQMKSLFKGLNGERRRCDYVLITLLDEEPLLVFFELKSKVISRGDISRQFKGAMCLMDYCDSALHYFHESQEHLLGQCEKYFVVFYRPSIAKQPTRFRCPERVGTNPDDPLKYASPHCPSLRSLVRACSGKKHPALPH